MSKATTFAPALDLIEERRQELAQIHRAKEYAQWRSGAVRELGEALAKLPPFDAYADARIFTGDGGSMIASTRFGEWVIDRLVAKEDGEAILDGFANEVTKNTAVYLEVSPLFGVAIDATSNLAEDVHIVPASEAGLWWRSPAGSHWTPLPIPPPDCAYLTQAYQVTPAFEVVSLDGKDSVSAYETVPPATERDAVRQRARLACILAGSGAVELPLSFVNPDRKCLFSGGEGNLALRPISASALFSRPVEAADVKRTYEDLARFAEYESLARAVDRLGRSRLARSPVDQALELGIAAEIALMHGDSSSNAEITYKLGSRAAWLLGGNAEERAVIFGQIGALYHARSKAVHEGILPKKSKIDLADADILVLRTLNAIAGYGKFPIWSNLTMGGPA